MYAKVFEQIFDSSIAVDYTLRHVFMDLLVLADPEGVVDKTLDAIARRLNMPESIVSECIAKLMAPDASSRTPDHDGRRLMPLSEHRTWGWRIVNYENYKRMRDEEGRRSYHREFMRKKRASVKVCDVLLTPVNTCDALSTHAEAEAEAEAEKKPRKAPQLSNGDFLRSLKENPAYAHVNIDIENGKMDAWLKLHPSRRKTPRFVLNWLNKIESPLLPDPKPELPLDPTQPYKSAQPR